MSRGFIYPLLVWASMKTIESLLVEIIAVLDSPASRNLALDAWRVGQLKGEAEGVAFAEMVLAGVTRFVAHGPGGGGAVASTEHGSPT